MIIKKFMLNFIVNPTAGGKHGKKIKKCVQKLKSELDRKAIEHSFHFSDKKGGATILTKQLIEAGATDVIVVGGDGTLHEVINGFSNFESVNMGIVPCGTGNDFAFALNIPKDPIKALNLIINGTAKHTDFMQMPTVRGLNVIGMGIDVEVLKRYEKLKKKNKFGYTKCLIKTLCKFDYTEFQAEIGEKSTHYRSFIAAVANGCVFGGGIPICPVASPVDGALDFLAVKSIKKLGIIGAFLKLKKGKVLSLRQTCHEKITEINIKTSSPCTVNVDGELYENIPFNVKIISNTLKIYR